jgi:chromate transporter
VEVTSPRVSLADIFLVFAKVSLTSFGGGLSGWMFREFVEVRGWFTESEFLSSLAICQAMPGVNVVNLSVWLGFKLRGTLGALVGFFAMIFPALTLIIVLALAYSTWGQFTIVHHALAGVAAAALALTLNMGSRVTIAASRDIVAIAVVALVFIGVGILRWSMVELVVAVAPLSVAWAFYRLRAR